MATSSFNLGKNKKRAKHATSDAHFKSGESHFDFILADKIKEGSAEAFMHIVSAHQTGVYNTVLSLTQSAGQAKKITVKVFLKAWKNRNIFTSTADCRIILYKMLFEEFYKTRLLRALARVFRRRAGGVLKYDMTSAQIIETSKNALSTFCKQCYVLKYEQNFKISEMSEILDKKESKVKDALFNATYIVIKNLKRFTGGKLHEM
jgi:DNA-directed RNA polymerase specialized sigma24 family protein